MARTKGDTESDQDAMRRMNEALKAALKTPPRKHKDEPKRRPSDKKAPK